MIRRLCSRLQKAGCRNYGKRLGVGNRTGQQAHISSAGILESIGADQELKMISDLIGGRGKLLFSVLRLPWLTRTHLDFFHERKLSRMIRPYKDIELAAVVYGDDQKKKATNEALGLFRSYPDLKRYLWPDNGWCLRQQQELCR